MAVIELRVDSMNNFIHDLERDTERGLYISSYRSFMALEEYIILNGVFLNNLNNSFYEVLINGSINGYNSSIMLDSRFPDWIGNIQLEAQNFNINVNITINNISVYQIDPWRVNVDSNLTFLVNDSTGLVYWIMNKSIGTSFSILEFEDPLYIVYSLGRTTNTINITPFDDNFTYKIGETWYVDNLMEHINNSYYLANTDAPSFLMRFEGNRNSSAHGIESLVDLKKLEDVGFKSHELNTDSSIVDYYYWIGVDNGDYRINFTPSWVRIDAGHRTDYDVLSISYVD